MFNCFVQDKRNQDKERIHSLEIKDKLMKNKKSRPH